MNVQLVDRFRNTVTATIVVTAANVVMRMKGETVGQFSRGELETWLRRPQHEIESGRVIMVAVPNGVALGIHDAVDLWPLSDRTVAQLRRVLAAESVAA